MDYQHPSGIPFQLSIHFRRDETCNSYQFSYSHTCWLLGVSLHHVGPPSGSSCCCNITLDINCMQNPPLLSLKHIKIPLALYLDVSAQYSTTVIESCVMKRLKNLECLSTGESNTTAQSHCLSEFSIHFHDSMLQDSVKSEAGKPSRIIVET